MNVRTEIRPDLWEAISKHYESQIYSSAILEAIHFLSDTLRERANVDGDGMSLVGQALGGESPRTYLKINWNNAIEFIKVAGWNSQASNGAG